MRPPSRAIAREPIAGEEWRPIPGWEGIYEVSNIGRVYRVKEPGFPRSGRILRPIVDRGYHHASLWRERKPSRVSIHSLVLLAFVGPRPAGLVIRHLDGDPSNNRVGNLRYGTYSENAHDKVRHGRDHNASRTHCIRGHEFTPENIYVQPSTGGRRCRTCKAMSSRAWWAEKGPAYNARRWAS